MLSEADLVLRLLAAVVLGAVVGWEREASEESAGLRTHMLVSVGAALFTVVSLSVAGADPARIAAGVVTGIGFLGAGAIFRAKDHVKGLTTAASVWTVAAIGVASGMGYYTAAIITTAMVFAVLYLKRIKKRV